MHNAYKVGSYWQNITNYEMRANCPQCNCDKTLEHILTKCTHLGRAPIWKLVKTLHKKRGIKFENPSLGDQLGCALVAQQVKLGYGKVRAKHFSTIIVSEAPHAIWKARCKWRILDESDLEMAPTDREMMNKLKAAIEHRARLDCLTTDKVW